MHPIYLILIYSVGFIFILAIAFPLLYPIKSRTNIVPRYVSYYEQTDSRSEGDSEEY